MESMRPPAINDDYEKESPFPNGLSSEAGSIRSVLSSWWVSLFILCGLMVIAVSISSNGETNDFAFLVGYYFFHSIVLSAVFVTLKRPSRRVVDPLLAFLAILSSFVAGDVLAFQINMRSVIGNKTEVIEALDRVIALGDSGGDRTDDSKSDPTGESGSAAVLPNFLDRMTKEIVASKEQYQQDLSTAQWQMIIDPNRLKKDLDGSETLQIASDSMLALAKHRARIMGFYERLPKDAEAVDLPPRMKAQFMAGVQRSLPSSRAEMIQILESDQSIIETYTRMAQFLQLRRGKWDIQNARLVFGNRTDLDDYSALARRVAEATAIQEKLKDQSGNRLREIRNDMADALRK